MGGKRTRRSVEVESEKVSPPSKMRNSSESSKSDEILAKLDALEERFKAVETEVGELSRVLREMEAVKTEVDTLKSICSSYQRFELESKRRSVLVRGLPFKSHGKFETRVQTRAALAEFFTKLDMTPTLVDYQRLGGLRENENQDQGSKIAVRVQFVDLDQKFDMYDKLKVKGRELKEISILTDYPSFQIPEFKKLSGEAFNLRQANSGTRTRIVPKGLGLVLQKRTNGSDRWTTVSSQ
jgi:hypothetical protein